MSLNRAVVLLTPTVFAPLAGAAAAWLAKHFPGADVKQEDLQEIFIGGALIALAPAAQWLHGWQKHEAREAEAAQQALELANAQGEQEDDEDDEDAPEAGTLSLDELLALAEGNV